MDSRERFVWIRTQDGSPTLWNNDLGEPYRSAKGAYSESLLIFALPALRYIRARNLSRVVVGEFGLGLGTNWLLFSTLARHFRIEVDYFAIERDESAFAAAAPMWREEASRLEIFLGEHVNEKVAVAVDLLPTPSVFETPARVPASLRADIWFHDPFGFGVNPEGYSAETLAACKPLWADRFLGLSYACNSAFQRVLQGLEISRTESLDVLHPPLKRERLEFER